MGDGGQIETVRDKLGDEEGETVGHKVQDKVGDTAGSWDLGSLSPTVFLTVFPLVSHLVAQLCFPLTSLHIIIHIHIYIFTCIYIYIYIHIHTCNIPCHQMHELHNQIHSGQPQ